MSAPTLDDVRAHCELNAGMFEAQAEALRAKVGGGAGEVQAFNAAIYRFALAALDDAERWRAVKAHGWEIKTDDAMDDSARVHVRAWDRDGTPYWIATGEDYDDAIANAIDAARREGA